MFGESWNGTVQSYLAHPGAPALIPVCLKYLSSSPCSFRTIQQSLQEICMFMGNSWEIQWLGDAVNLKSLLC